MKRLLSLLVLLPTLALANAVTLDATTKTLEVTTGTSASTDYVVSYVDGTATTFTPGTAQGNIASATTTTILAAPAASTQRAVSLVTLVNRGTTAQTAQLKLDVSATEYALTPVITIPPGYSVRVENDGEVKLITRGGMTVLQASENVAYTGQNYRIYKVGSASEAAGVENWQHAYTGIPGAWVPGTPGVNGANADCSTAAGATILGSPLMPNPASGAHYMTYASAVSSVVHSHALYDVLWYNTGLSVTTTGAQAITTPTLPARDATGTTNGEGVYAALIATTTVANAAAVTNTTLNYTNSDGTATRTATISSFPQTGVQGAMVLFQLQAGDRGIRSIQGVTLGTSYVSGTLSLALVRPLFRVPVNTAQVGGALNMIPSNPGVRLYNGTCIWATYWASATTATNTNFDFWVMER